MLLDIMGVTCGYGASTVLKNATLKIENMDWAGIVGPNGSGKSTLLRTMSRVLKPSYGNVLLNGKDVYQLTPTQTAREIAVLTQGTGLEFPYTVKDLVMMGRLPHIKRFAREGAKDREAVDRAMELTDTSHLAGRQINELSGGEKQRVLLARALAQEPSILLLDEPTSYLDLKYQLELMDLLTGLRRDSGLTIVSVLHDLNLASRYCDYLIFLKDGVVYAIGTPAEVVTGPMIREVYGCTVDIGYTENGERPYIVFK